MGIADRITSLFGRHDTPMLCEAPLNNMLIDQQGNVRICCHNSNDFTIGKYPEQSMHDIWFGEPRKKMVAEMRDGKIPAACADCIRNGINTHSPDSKVQTSRTSHHGSLNAYPQQIEMLLDNECNLSCIMCASNKSSTLTVAGFVEQPINFGPEFLKQMEPFFDKVQFTVFSGGEPFLIPLYIDIWEYLRKHNPTAGIYVQTNGTVLNNIVKERLHKFHIQLGVSVDALTPEVYESIRVNSRFPVLLKNLEYFQECSAKQGNRMTLMMTPMTVNAMEVPKMLEYCNVHELILSLSILNWPYHLAIWAMPSEEIFKLLTVYKVLLAPPKAPSNVVVRNNEVFAHYVALVEGYYNTRKKVEANRVALKADVLRKADVLKHALIALLKSPEKEETKFASSILEYVETLQREFTPQLEYTDFVFMIFNGKELTYFKRLFASEAPEKLLIMGRNRLRELLFLLEKECYEKL